MNVNLTKGVHVHVWEGGDAVPEEPIVEIDAVHTGTYDDHYQVCFEFGGKHFEMRIFKQETR